MSNNDDRIDRLINHYERVARACGITSSVWAMFDVVDLHAPVPFTIKGIVYKRHWGKHEIHVGGDDLPLTTIKTWIDVWRACDMAIRLSGDQHHLFIEKLTRAPGDGVFELTTGS